MFDQAAMRASRAALLQAALAAFLRDCVDDGAESISITAEFDTTEGYPVIDIEHRDARGVATVGYSL